MLPDIELTLTTWARMTFDVTTCTALPADLIGSLPVIQITAIGGLGERFSSSPRIDVDVYAGSYEEAKDLSAQVHEALMFLHGSVGDAVIRNVLVSALPSRRPYDNSGLQRVGATYLVSGRPNLFA